MQLLFAHAKTLGVTIHTATLPRPYRGFYDAENNAIVCDARLTPAQRAYVLAHELGHAYYNHRGENPRFEEAADIYAALLLIDPEMYAKAEAFDASAEGIADELGVTPELVKVYQSRVLVRIGNATYVRPKMGLGQYTWKWSA